MTKAATERNEVVIFDRDEGREVSLPSGSIDVPGDFDRENRGPDVLAKNVLLARLCTRAKRDQLSLSSRKLRLIFEIVLDDRINVLCRDVSDLDAFVLEIRSTSKANVTAKPSFQNLRNRHYATL